MTDPWLLVAGIGFTVGALGGWSASVLYAAVVAMAVAATRERWVALTVVALVAAGTGSGRVAIAPLSPVDDAVVESVRLEGRVVSHPQSGPSGPRAVVAVERVQLTDAEVDWVPAEGRVLVFFGDSASNGIGRHDLVRVRGTVTALNEQEPGFRWFIRSSGASANGWAFHTMVLERGRDPANVLIRARNDITDRFEQGVGGDAGALLAGFVTGDDSGLSAAARDAFERTNTSHITAVSGSNVAVLLSLWLTMLPSRRMQRALWAQVSIVAVIWIYVLLVGLGPGAVRAGLFASIMLPAARLGRRPDPLTALMLASAMMLLARPGFAENIGFWLSMAASAAMVTVVSGRRPARRAWWRQGVSALLAAQIATFPITFWAFDGWSVGSLVANLIVGPLVAMVFPIAFVFAGIFIVVPWVGDLMAWAPKLAADAIIAIVTSLAGEFPLSRSGVMSPATILLLVSMSGLAIAGMSQDAQRWLHRLVVARSLEPSTASVALLGGAVGVWVAVLVLAVLA
jgi:competence protein ComEC